MKDPPAMLLNFDVFFVIMSHLPRKDISALMRTCHTLYSGGVPKLFARHTSGSMVRLDTSRQLNSLHQFVKADTARYKFITLLYIALSSLEEKDGLKAALVDLLRGTRQSLSLLGITNADILREDPRIIDAIAKVESLQVLLMNVGPITERRLTVPLHLLATMTSKVRMAVFDFGWEDQEEDIVASLANFSSSLEKLAVHNVDFVSQDIKYVHMKHLHIGYMQTFNVAALIQAYPNLQTLGIAHRYPHNLLSEDVREEREENTKFQRRHKTWDRLEYVNAQILPLYILAICCKVRFLRVGFLPPPSSSGPDTVDWLCAILADCRPSIVHIGCNERDFGAFSQIARSIADNKTHLVLSVELSPTVLDYAWLIGALDRLLLPALRSLAMSEFTLSLAPMNRSRPDYSSSNDEDGLNRTELVLRRVDVEALAYRIMFSLPSLDYLGLHVCCNPRPETHWQTSKEGYRSLVEVGLAYGRKEVYEPFEYAKSSSSSRWVDSLPCLTPPGDPIPAYNVPWQLR
ncbi:hypothetical protein PHLCEN_2v5120 [Hermanssonia centrifuga]|uniref:F-box domain-containing protein n=1 Tax=Hermanssonia centrifuga TaxID=98765 RepID=A0A2R6PBY6_9APHY|nr:hypothetical protein PHLCEN_2v5120 [Hermanssonia centrifuga]